MNIGEKHREIVGVLIVFFLSALTFRNINGYHGDWQTLIDAAMGITEGRPHWRAFQNRLLGPYSILGMHTLGFTVKQSMLIYTALLLLLHNLLFYALLRRQSVTTLTAVALVCLWSFLFMALQCPWLYAWDMLDIIIFTLASYIIVYNKDSRLLLALFPLALLNRETALFLPLGYVIVEIARHTALANTRLPRLNGPSWARIIFGVFLIFCGAAYTSLVRDWLFIESSWGGQDIGNPLLIGNQSHLLVQIKSFTFNNFRNGNIIHTALMWLSVIYMLALARRSNSTGIYAGAMFFLAFWLGIFFFGVINETRLFFPTLSLAIFLVVSQLNKNSLRRLV